MPIDLIAIKSAATTAKHAAGAAFRFLDWREVSQARRADHDRRARANAERLEQYALACREVIRVNKRSDFGMDNPPIAELAMLPRGKRTGNSRRDLQLEGDYEDLQKRIRELNARVDGTWGDPEEEGDPWRALDELAEGAWDIADRALRLARRYRRRCGLRRDDVGGRIQKLEQQIRDRHYLAADPPARWRFLARAARARAKERQRLGG